MGGDARLNFDQFNERSRVSSISGYISVQKRDKKGAWFS